MDHTIASTTSRASRTARRLLAALVTAAVALQISPAAAADQARGESLYQLCGACHGDTGAGNRLFLAPAIAGLPEWYLKRQLDNFRGGLRGMHFDDISGMRMRPMSLVLRSDADVAEIAAFVAGMPATRPTPEVEGGNAARGKAVYDASCGSCHGPAGEGLEALSGPAMRNASDWYLLDQLQKFKAGVRGGNPANPIAIMMRPMAIALDDQAMKDVVAYVVSLAE